MNLISFINNYQRNKTIFKYPSSQTLMGSGLLNDELKSEICCLLNSLAKVKAQIKMFATAINYYIWFKSI